MGEPWGLSGPQFLDIYRYGMVAMVAVPIVVRQVVLGTPGRAPSREIDPYELAYLSGGAERAADVAITEFTHSGALRVDSMGQVHKADRTAGAASLASIRYGIELGSVADLLTTAGARRALAGSSGIAAIRDRLRADGLIMSGRRAAAPRLVALVLTVALLVTGILRFREGVANGRPVGSLTTLLIWSFILGIIALLIHLGMGRTTRRGKAALRYARQARQANQVPAPLSGFGAGGYDPEMTLPPGGVSPGGYAARSAPFSPVLFGVALGGLFAVQDAELRSALIAGLPTSTSGGSSSDSGSSSTGCGGGSSCGSSSCGGGSSSSCGG